MENGACSTCTDQEENLPRHSAQSVSARRSKRELAGVPDPPNRWVRVAGPSAARARMAALQSYPTRVRWGSCICGECPCGARSLGTRSTTRPIFVKSLTSFCEIVGHSGVLATSSDQFSWIPTRIRSRRPYSGPSWFRGGTRRTCFWTCHAMKVGPERFPRVDCRCAGLRRAEPLYASGAPIDPATRQHGDVLENRRLLQNVLPAFCFALTST